MYIINLSYLKDGLLYFTEFSEGNINELNKMLVGLDIATVISETDNQNLIDLIDLEVEWANKKKEKAKRYQ